MVCFLVNCGVVYVGISFLTLKFNWNMRKSTFDTFWYDEDILGEMGTIKILGCFIFNFFDRLFEIFQRHICNA